MMRVVPLVFALLVVASRGPLFASEPLTREECLAAALADNPAIGRSRSGLEQAAGTQLVYHARGWPRANGQLRGGWRRGDLYGDDDDGPFTAATLRLSQPLIDVGIPASRRRGRLERVLAQQRYYQAVTDQLAATEEMFLWTWYYQETLQIQHALAARLHDNVSARNQQLDAGLVGRAAVVEARVQLLDLETRTARTEQELHHARTRLAELVGQPATDWLTRSVRFPEDVALTSSTTIDWAAAVTAAHATRPDLQLLRVLVAAAEEDERIQRAGYYPRIELVANGFAIPDSAFRRVETEVVPGRDTRTSEVRVGPVMSWRVIDDGRTTGARRVAQARAEQFRVLLAALETNLPREFARVRAMLESAAARQRTMTTAVDQADESLRLVEQKLHAGAAAQIDYLNAQRNLLALQRGLAWDRFQYARALVDFRRASGGYLGFVDMPAAH